jgi:hypothetical protein
LPYSIAEYDDRYIDVSKQKRPSITDRLLHVTRLKWVGNCHAVEDDSPSVPVDNKNFAHTAAGPTPLVKMPFLMQNLSIFDAGSKECEPQ